MSATGGYPLQAVQFDDLLLKIQRALEFRELSRDRKIMSEQLAATGEFQNIVSELQRWGHTIQPKVQD